MAKLLGDLTAMRNADTRCILCNRVGFTHRERTITAGQSFVEYACGACQSIWRVFDAEPCIERRVAAADRRRVSRGDRRRGSAFHTARTAGEVK